MADVDADVNAGSDDDLTLAADFPAATHEQWAALVAKVLGRGGAVPDPAVAEQKLSTTTLDGLTVRPLYTAEDLPTEPAVRPALRSAGTPGWDIRARYSGAVGSAATNDAILTDLASGVTSVWLQVGAGVSVADLPAVLDGVYLDLAPVVLDAGPHYLAATRALLALAADAAVPAAELRMGAGADPIGTLLRAGEGGADLDAAATFAAELASSHPAVVAITVDATVVHEAGASDAQEIGYSLAAGLAYLKALTAAGLSLEAAAGTIEFRYAITDDQFAGIAKLRAARLLWSRLTQVAGLSDGALQAQHAVSSWAMLTRPDPWVNILRGTLACFAAGVGGAQAVTVLPYDSATGADSTLSRRIARNTSSLMIDESNLGRVIDPAGGSFYVERRTDELAAAAWSFFQAVEGSGGVLAGIADGSVAAAIAATAAARARRLATRAQPITGVSEFPNLLETIAAADPPESASGLPRERWSQLYEALRGRSDGVLANTGRRPKVALVTIGSRRDFSGRLGFAAGAIAPGGLDGVPVDIDDADALRAVFAGETGASTAVLCSSDDVYAVRAVEAAALVKAAGARTVLLAGKPGDAEADYRAGGIDDFAFIGCDLVALNAHILDMSGVRA